MDRRIRRVRVALGVALTLLVVHLALGDNPWHDGVAERLDEGKSVRPKDLQATYGWWPALLCAVATLAAWWTVPRWLPGVAPERASLAPPRAPRGFVLGVALAVALGGALALPRMDHGLWQDEDHAARAYIAGAYLADDDGELRFWSKDWGDTLLYDFGPSNAIGFTVLAKLSTDAWRLVTRPADRRVDEVAFRVPAFAWGLVSIAAVAWLLLRLGFPAAGLVAAFFLALHPWHLRYASEARGYSMLMALTTLGVLLALAVLHRGTWARWVGYGVAQFALLWTHPAAVYHVALLNVVLGAALWRQHRGAGARASQLGRFVGVNAASGLVWLTFMAGNVVILGRYLEGKSRELGVTFLRELFAHLATGTPWSHGAADPRYPELADWAASHPVLLLGWALASVALVARGAFVLARRHELGAWLLVPMLLSAPIAWAVAYLRADFLYGRNLLFALPMLAALAALGFEVRGPRATRALAPALAAVWIGAYAAMTEPTRHALRVQPITPYRESVVVTRGTVDPFAPGQDAVLTASFSAEPYYYDPRVHMVDDPRELRALMARADDEGVPLFVNLGRLGLARRRHPELLAMVDSERFEEVAVLHAFEPHYSRRVYRYRGAGS